MLQEYFTDIVKACTDVLFVCIGWAWLAGFLRVLDTLSQHILLEGGAALVVARIVILMVDVRNKRRPKDSDLNDGE